MCGSAASVCRWSSERSCGLEDEPLLGINSGRDEEGGSGEVWGTSELLTAEEGGREERFAVPVRRAWWDVGGNGGKITSAGSCVHCS